MEKLLFIQESSHDMSELFCEKLQKNYSVHLAKGSSEGLKVTDVQEFNGICKFYDTHEDSTTSIVEALKKSQMNRQTPLILLTRAIEEALVTFRDYKNIHVIDISLNQDSIAEKIHHYLHPDADRFRKISLDAELISMFVKSSVSVITTMGYASNVSSLIPLPYKKELPFEPFSTAYTPIKTESFTGFFSVSFPKQTFFNMAEHLFEEHFTELTPDIKDMHVEIINMIYGQVRTEFMGLGCKLDSLIPMSCNRTSTLVNSLGSGPSIIIPIITSAGKFYISASLGFFQKS